MPSLFERAFLQAVKRRRIHRPTRLKTTIHSVQSACMFFTRAKPQSQSPAENTQPVVEKPRTEEVVVSGAMEKLLMRKGFGVRPRCIRD